VDPWNNNTYNNHLTREEISKYGARNDKIEDDGDGVDEGDNEGDEDE